MSIKVYTWGSTTDGSIIGIPSLRKKQIRRFVAKYDESIFIVGKWEAVWETEPVALAFLAFLIFHPYIYTFLIIYLFMIVRSKRPHRLNFTKFSATLNCFTSHVVYIINWP